MIEIGKNYRLTTLKLCNEGYDTESIVVTVTAQDGNLLQVNGSEILNLASPLFHSLVDEEKQAEHYKRLESEFMARLSEDDKQL